MSWFLICSTALLLMSSCHTKTNAKPNKFVVLLPDTAKTHYPDNRFTTLVNRGKQLNLPKLDTGVTGTMIRLWKEGISTPHLLICINISDTSVGAEKFYYKIIENGMLLGYKDSIDAFNKDSLRVLAAALKKTDFTKMISQAEITNFKDNVADGIFYDVEIANSRYYKLLSYHCPEQFAKTEINNKIFLDLILLLDKQFHFF